VAPPPPKVEAVAPPTPKVLRRPHSCEKNRNKSSSSPTQLVSPTITRLKKKVRWVDESPPLRAYAHFDNSLPVERCIIDRLSPGAAPNAAPQNRPLCCQRKLRLESPCRNKSPCPSPHVKRYQRSQPSPQHPGFQPRFNLFDPASPIPARARSRLSFV
jgi:hypothetical protein